MNVLRDWFELLSAPHTAGVLMPLHRITLVLLVAWLAHVLLGGANPRWRILVWRVTAVGVVTITAFSVAGPLVTLPVLPVAAESVTVQATSFHRTNPTGGEPGSRSPWLVGHSAAVPAKGSAPIQTPVKTGTASSMANSPIKPVVAAESNAVRPALVLGGMLLIWLIGVAAVLFRTLVGVVHVRKICRSATTAPGRVDEELARIQQHFRPFAPVLARQTDAVTTPCSVGFVRGMILLPTALCQEGRREELRAALIHEAAHFHGGDLKWNHLLHAISMLLWFHPLTWRIRLAHADACDERCDAEAAQYLGGTETYGRSLARIALAATGRTAPATLAMARRKGVNRRIDMLKLGVGRNRLHIQRTVTVIAAAACLILAVAATGIGPSKAGEQPATDSAKTEAATDEPVVPAKTVRDDEPNTAVTSGQSEPAIDTESSPVHFSVVVAGQALLLDGTSITTWEDIEQKIAEMDDPSLAYPHFYITGGARQVGKSEEAKKKIWGLHKKYKLRGHSEGSLQPRTDRRYDAIHSKVDLRPDDALRKTRIVLLDGKPVAGAEVVLIAPVDKSIPYQTYDLALVEGRIRNRLEHVMAVSDDAGKFTLYPPHDTPYYVLAAHPGAGFALVTEEQFKNDRSIRLRAWAGLVVGFDDPKHEQQVDLTTSISAFEGRPEISINQYGSELHRENETNEFHYGHIPSFYETTILRSLPTFSGGQASVSAAKVSILPGETRYLHLGAITPQQLNSIERLRTGMRPASRLESEPKTPEE